MSIGDILASLSFGLSFGFAGTRKDWFLDVPSDGEWEWGEKIFGTTNIAKAMPIAVRITLE